MRDALAAAALVEEDDPVALGIEVAPAAAMTAGAGSAVDDERGLAVRVAARLPVDAVPVAHVQEAVRVRLERRVRASGFHARVLAAQP
jgi:hypothetical protein